MLKEFKFPDIGEGIEEGKIVKWLIKESDVVEEHQVVGEVETDKAVAEIPSPYSGKILKINFKEGDTVKVGEVLFTVEGTASAETPAGEEKKVAAKEAVGPTIKPAGAVGYLEEATSIEMQRGFVTPAVRKLAKELGIDLSKVKGTGPGGRITEEDIKSAGIGAPSVKPAMKIRKKYNMWGYIDHAPLIGIRRAIARHMVEAVKHAPQVTIMEELDASALVKVKEEQKKKAEKEGISLTYLPFIMKALVTAMKEYPRVNAEVDEEAQEIIIKKYYNFGVAVDVDGEGLVVPVLKGVDIKDIFAIAKEIKELADNTRIKKLDLQDMKGGTFTVTNFGSLGSWFATPIVNYPEVTILGIGRMKERAIVVDGKVIVRPIMPLSLTFDHRVLDGAYAIRFLASLMVQLQNPEKL